MKIGFIGLGKMGKNMALTLLNKGIEVVGYSRSPEATNELINHGLIPAFSIEQFFQKLGKDRKIVWLMVPNDVVESVVFDEKEGIIKYLKEGDLIVDGGNSYFKNSIKLAERLIAMGVDFLDCGTSGGPKGALTGLSLMIGGKRDNYEELKPLWEALAKTNGYGYVGGYGAGHFVKMVHNAIEYGFMQALGEGFELMSKYDEKLDLEQIANIWSNGSVIESKLVEFAAKSLSKDADLSEIDGYIEDLGETRWTVKEAIDREVPMSSIAEALFNRYSSRNPDSFSRRLIAALRNEFGKHGVKKK